MKTSHPEPKLRESSPARRSSRRVSRVLILGLLSIAGVVRVAGPAVAAEPVPAWSVKAFAAPSVFSSQDNSLCITILDCDAYAVTVTNVGGSAASGVVIRDRLPAGVTAVNYEDPQENEPNGRRRAFFSCTVEAQLATCDYPAVVPPYAVVGFRVVVMTSITKPSSLVTNVIEAEGGGAAPVHSAVENMVNGGPVGFALQAFTPSVIGPEGVSDAQAGAHPVISTTSLNWTTISDPAESELGNFVTAVEEPKSQVVDLPAGFVGDASALERCPVGDVKGTKEARNRGNCPVSSQVGFVTIEASAGEAELQPVYNVPPETGYPAEFAFEYVNTIVTLVPRLLPTQGGYALSVSVPYIPRVTAFKITGAVASFFGDPSETNMGRQGEAFLTNPDDCGAKSLMARAEIDSWLHPENWVAAEAPMYEASSSQGVSGCSALTFQPTIAVTPETTETDTPSGYEVDVSVPQSANTPGVLATPDLKDAVVSLPAGTSISPSAANGLAACQASGPEGIELGNNDKLGEGYGAQEGEEIGLDGLVHPARGHCPQASQVGEVEVVSPDLPNPLKGHVYVAAPQCGGTGQPQCTPHSAEDGELFGIYLEVAGEGIIVKLKGKVSVNPQTGRVTTSFDEDPQLPFSELKLKLDGGARAPLANSQSCGTAATNADFTPWSTPYTPDATPNASFVVTGCGGGFGPSFTAGTVSPLAGSYSPFTLTFSRHDGEQDLSGVTVNMPEGLIGKIAGFAQCGEAEIHAAEQNTGGCPATAQVGTATAAAGAGSTPFYQSGPVYLTGPYNGGPFGLAVVVPANAGPFHLGNIVVRAAIHINPETAQVTVVSNPLPQMIDGVPLRVQTVNVTVGQGNDFTFNATSCEPKSIGAGIASAQGATANVSSSYQAQGCTGLKFAPVFSASTVGKASRAGGAGLDVKVAYPSSPLGTYANVAKVKVALPKQLPSRLTTLQKACTAAQFAANPAGCPSASNIGTATVRTPVLANPLTGPAFLVSHGGEAFPQLEIVLQGEGVAIDLIGDTDIKKGVTTSTFNSVPDAPVSSFELKLPTGKYSILSANVPAKNHYSLCGQTLAMPTTITGQNGAVIKQTTKIAVTGCPKVKAAKKKKATEASHGHNNGRMS